MADEEQTPESQAPAAEGGAVDGRKVLRAFGDVDLEVAAMLGTVTLPIEQVLKLSRGAIIELTTKKDADIDLCVNGHVVARGEVTILDKNIGLTVTDVRKMIR
ncbi:MAG: FliM/FliN family flagellar motor switch protein [Rickettsiales bacterium]|nr:FliM/FliN family flagellar motor switch protein [Rickettsiales bacterium]